MVDTGTLGSIAGIGAGFMGFAALISLQSKKPMVYRIRLQYFMLLNLLVTSVPLVPLVLIAYGFSIKMIWQISCLVFLVSNWIAVSLFFRVCSRYKLSIFYCIGSRLQNFLIWTAEIFLEVPMIIIAMGHFVHNGPAVFLTSLIIVLFQSAQLFIVMTLSNLKHMDDI